MSQTPALLLAASLVVCATLLWLSAELAAEAARRSSRVGRSLLAVSIGLGACALWWPSNILHVPTTFDPAHLPRWVWAGLPALLLSALAGVVGVFWEKERRHLAALAAIGMPAGAYVFAMLNAPGVFRLTAGPGWLGAGTLTLGLSAALVCARLRASEAPLAHALRALGGMVAAAAVCIGAALSVSSAEAARWVVGPEWGVMAVLMSLGTVMLFALRQGKSGKRATATPAAALDHLTGLPSRLFFESRLQLAAKRCVAKSSRMALLFIDLDGFKPVNDTFGHASGDRVLEQVGQRMKALARGKGVAARVGGDEFLLLATDSGATDAVAELARRLIDTLSQPYALGGREVTISCSVGIALYPDDKADPAKLIARADAAMYAAKRAGGARHCFYAPEMDAGTQRNFDLLLDLRRALANDEFELYFQPKIDARSGKVTAAEALLRWKSATHGIVLPASFIPLAERSGLIGPIGNWVIEAACKQARAWRDKGLRMRVAINLSAHQMRQDDIADRIADALTRHRIHPSLLTCEITETAAMEDTGATQEALRRLGELGVHLSIDDFGTGYSSLGYLRQLPAEELKIDASFVKDLEHSADARAVIDAVIKLAHALGLKVVAEGVETVRQQAILVELGCDELQGYLFARPMSARALLLWALDDRSQAAVFRESLFVDKNASRQSLRQVSTQDE